MMHLVDSHEDPYGRIHNVFQNTTIILKLAGILISSLFNTEFLV